MKGGSTEIKGNFSMLECNIIKCICYQWFFFFSSLLFILVSNQTKDERTETEEKKGRMFHIQIDVLKQRCNIGHVEQN